jgi:UPF0716 protein FxsA
MLLLIPILAEIALFILVAKAIGVLATLGLVVAAMVAGALILRSLGPKTVERVRADLAMRRTPARPIAEGAATAAAAILLIVPGFFSDLLGLLLLIPGVREGLWRWMASRVRVVSLRSTSPMGEPPLVELEADEYIAAPRRGSAADSPWRGQGRGE